MLTVVLREGAAVEKTQVQLGDFLADAFSDLHGGGKIGVGEQDEEFLAAPTAADYHIHGCWTEPPGRSGTGRSRLLRGRSGH